MAAELRLPMPPFRSPALRVLGVVLCAGALASCAGKPESAIDDTPTEHSVRPSKSTGKSAAAKAEAKEGLVAAGSDLQAMYDQLAAAQGERPAPDDASPTPNALPRPSNAQRPGRSIITPTAADLPPGALDPAPAAATGASSSPGAAPAKPAAAERTAAQKRSDAAAELATQLKPDISAVSEPLRAALPLIALETIQPGSASADLDKLQNALAPRERDAIRTLREFSRTLASDPNMRADPEAVARALREHADRLSASTTNGGAGALGLGTVTLCSRVDGFGRFNTLPTTFLAGKAIPAIVYAEVRNFAQRPGADASGEPTWNIELSQELQLILEADGSRQWQQPETIVRDVSRSQRSDYFLVQRIDLPKNLSVGKYTLRVVIRDKAANAEAETLVPIQIVADPSLLGGGRGPRAGR